MNAQEYNWTKFKRRSYIKANPEKVFAAWTKPNEIIKWFIAEAEYTSALGKTRDGDANIQVGDEYYWRWHQNVETRGKVLELEEGCRIQFTFGEGKTELDEQIIVTVEVFEIEPGTTLLELTQENMPDTAAAHVSWHLGCNMGWAFFITNLKALLEHGIDLREYSEERATASRAINLATI